MTDRDFRSFGQNADHRRDRGVRQEPSLVLRLCCGCGWKGWATGQRCVWVAHRLRWRCIPALRHHDLTGITALASVGAAVGTVGAVAVALWRSRPDRPHLYMECISETSSDDPTAPAYLNVRVTNRGTRPASLEYPPFFVAERRVNKLEVIAGNRVG